MRMIAPNSCGDDRPDQPANRNSKPTADFGADNADDDVAKEAEAANTHNQPGERAGDGTRLKER